MLHFREIFFIIFLLIFPTLGFQWGQWPCAEIYSEQDYTGQKLFIKDGTQFMNLDNVYIGQNTTWENATKSFNVTPRCTLETCNDTVRFFGTCEYFNTSSPNPPKYSSPVRLAYCKCDLECRCSSIHIKRHICARVYVDGDCNDCHSSYFELNYSKDEEVIPPAYESRASFLVVREGCSLIGYQQPEYGGDPTNYTGFVDMQKIDGWNIGSFYCSCSDFYRQKPKRYHKANYPMIEIPKSLDKIRELIKNETVRHPALTMAVKSLYKKRSTSNAYILALGITGSGKSSTINVLFDNPNLTKVGASKSTTKSIHEFRIPVPVEEFGISNSQLRVIDTPGLGDTESLEQDAKFLATIEEYFDNHEDLKTKIPNVILIFHKFTDNRYDGIGSPFVKVLRCLELLRHRILDENHSNVIFVFTHFMASEPKIQRKPQEKLASFRRVIEEYTTFPRPIILTVAENKATHYDIPFSYEGYHKLPNQEYYPRNLFEKIQHMTKMAGDPIGEAIVTAAFRESEYFNITTVSKELLNTTDPNVDKYMKILLKASVQIKNTTISQKVENIYEEMNAELKKKYPVALPSLLSTLNFQRIFTEQDIPVKTFDIVKMLQTRTFDAAELYLLDKSLGIIPPPYPGNQVVGYSYNIFEDIPLSVSPYKLGNLVLTDMGYSFPTGVSCSRKEDNNEIYELFDTRNDYVNYRIRKLNVGGRISSERFKGQTQPGCNILIEITSNMKNSSIISVTAALEYRVFELTLNNRYELTEEYLRTVRSLGTFNPASEHSVNTWKRFFETYGTHVVKNVHAGGSVEIMVKRTITNSSLAEKELEEINRYLIDLLSFVEDIAVGNIGNLTDWKNEITQNLIFKGGDPAYHIDDLSKINLTVAVEKLEKWKNSISVNPAILTGEMQLLPLSILTKNVPQNIYSEIERASKLYFDSNLKYIPHTTTRPPSRAQTYTDPPKPKNFFQIIWNAVKSFFSRIFG